LQEDLRKIITAPLYVLAFVLMGLLSGYLAFKILSFSKTVEVPDLRGKTLFEANDLLTKRGLHLKVEGEDYDSTVVQGRIVRQDVPPASKVKEQRGIKVFLSKGPRVWSFPDLTGRTIEEAESAVSASGLRVEKVIRTHSSAVARDVIIAQRPRPDELAGGDESRTPQEIPGQRPGLTLVVSSGPYDAVYFCPDLAGKSRDEAASIAEKLRLTIDFTGSGERVKSQKPRPNSLIKSGETLHIYLEGD
jgi:serine/threonine-protein kinase